MSISLGHEKEVKALESLSLKDGLVLLVSLDVSGMLKIWDVFKEECLMTTEDSISCIVRSSIVFQVPLQGLCFYRCVVLVLFAKPLSFPMERISQKSS